MLKAILSLTFALFTVLAAQPTFANDQMTPAAQANCSSDYDCGYGNICEYNQCRPAQCFSDNSCFPWEECERGRCQRDPWATSCRTDNDCFGARFCRLGYCKRW